MSTKAKPLTEAQFKSKPRPGFQNYAAYLRWWNRTVAPKFAAKAPDPLQAQAEQMVSAQIQPQLESVREQQQKHAQQSQLQGQSIQGFSQALAQLLQGIGPQVQQGYQQAAQLQGQLGQGFSGALREHADANAAQMNQLLAQQGSPQTVQGGEAIANVLHGLGGYIPASTMAREGAAFGAAASQLPATAGRQGLEDFTALQFQTAEEQREFDRQVLEIERTRPGLLQQALAELNEARRKDEAMELNRALAEAEFDLKARSADRADRALDFNQALGEANFGLNQQKAAASQAATEQRLANERARIKIELEKLRQSAEGKRIQSGLQQARLSLDVDKHRLAVQREQRMAKPASKGGFTAAQKQKMSATAADTAADDYEAGRKPVDTLRDLIAAGVPFSLAIRAIQRQARKEGAPANWRATLKWTKK